MSFRDTTLNGGWSNTHLDPTLMRLVFKFPSTEAYTAAMAELKSARHKSLFMSVTESPNNIMGITSWDVYVETTHLSFPVRRLNIVNRMLYFASDGWINPPSQLVTLEVPGMTEDEANKPLQALFPEDTIVSYALEEIAKKTQSLEVNGTTYRYKVPVPLKPKP